MKTHSEHELEKYYKRKLDYMREELEKEKNLRKHYASAYSEICHQYEQELAEARATIARYASALVDIALNDDDVSDDE